MKQVRLVVNLSLNDDNTYTLHNTKVVSIDEGNQSRLDGYKTVEENYGNVSALFSAIQTTAVAIATSSLVS